MKRPAPMHNDPRKQWSLHCCALDKECRQYTGWMWRLHLNTPWGHLGIALRTKDKYARMSTLFGPAERTEWTSRTRYKDNQ